MFVNCSFGHIQRMQVLVMLSDETHQILTTDYQKSDSQD